MKRSHLLTAAAGALATLAAPAHALTVGEARVLSFTDQPLRVLIPIKAQGWEWRALWASAQTYQRGLGLTATLYKPTGDKTEGVIEIRSKAPITEPIVDLQITFETGHRTTIHRTPILIDVQHASATVVETQAPVPQNPLDDPRANSSPDRFASWFRPQRPSRAASLPTKWSLSGSASRHFPAQRTRTRIQLPTTSRVCSGFRPCLARHPDATIPGTWRARKIGNSKPRLGSRAIHGQIR